ncbi:MAG TPA: flagellar type III secretion system pore protein FliP [Clostridiaceae bacterium]|nr:flagellar type III secretion system pore protein FliP [Clostridiaceae bacterium]
MKKKSKFLAIFFLILIFFMYTATEVSAEPVLPFRIEFGNETSPGGSEVAVSIQILILLTILSLLPSIVIMLTSFTRTIIVLSFLRNAIGTQQMPPNQVLIGLALFITLFIMAPIGQEINKNALEPFNKGEIQQQEALDEATRIIKRFMLKQFKNESDLELFVNLAGIETPIRDPESLPMTVVIPAFLISELTIAFKMGFLIYIPFLIIDMIVSSTLMSMGMMMLPPAMISLPFKILLFIMVGGWRLISETIITSFVR